MGAIMAASVISRRRRLRWRKCTMRIVFGFWRRIFISFIEIILCSLLFFWLQNKKLCSNHIDWSILTVKKKTVAIIVRNIPFVFFSYPYLEKIYNFIPWPIHFQLITYRYESYDKSKTWSDETVAAEARNTSFIYNYDTVILLQSKKTHLLGNKKWLKTRII